MTATKLSVPGQAIDTDAGLLTITVSLTVEHAVAFNVFTGPTRIAELSGFALSNRADAAEVFRDIRDGGEAGMSIEDIAEKVRERLCDIRAIAARDRQAARVAEIDRVLDRVEPLAGRSDLAIPVARPARTWADVKADFAAGMAADQAARLN